MSQIRIDHYSDVLCIWAYVSHIRMEELIQSFGSKIDVHYHFFPVFGDVPGKIEKSWAHRGGVSAYRDHVLSVANKFGHVQVHPEVWVRATPNSSMPVHLYLAAVKLAQEKQVIAENSRVRFLQATRDAFFKEGRDIAQWAILHSLAEELGIHQASVEVEITSGAAHARVCADMQLAIEQQVNSSPTLIFNEGRQKLAGNVGYRIIEANVRELLENPAGQASWC